MRTIKFKAWDGKQMSEAATLRQLLVATSRAGVDEIQAWEGTYLQHTGLKDKNGKEAYHSDIAKAWYDCPVGFENEPHEVTGSIEQDEYGEWLLDLRHTQIPLQAFNDFEIIGNIYENLELLK